MHAEVQDLWKIYYDKNDFRGHCKMKLSSGHKFSPFPLIRDTFYFERSLHITILENQFTRTDILKQPPPKLVQFRWQTS